MAVSDINALRSDPQLTVDAVQRGTMYYVAMSMKEAHFANPKVREAVRYLIDYQGINKALMPGYGVLHQRPIKAGMPSTLPDLAISWTWRGRKAAGGSGISQRL